MEKLTNRQNQIYDFIETYVSEQGYPPTVRDIGEAVGLASSSTVHGHLEKLERKGYIRRDPTKPRAIELLHKKSIKENLPTTTFAPIIGKVTAGDPITALEDYEDLFPLPPQYAADEGNLFMLRISGDSMIEAGIHDHDLIVVKKQNTANNGEIVVAMTEDDEATVKRFFKEDGYYRLQPENSALSPILLDQVAILGKVVGVFRELN